MYCDICGHFNARYKWDSWALTDPTTWVRHPARPHMELHLCDQCYERLDAHLHDLRQCLVSSASTLSQTIKHEEAQK